MAPALLILDAQNDFFGSDNPNINDFLQSVRAINVAMDFFHQQRWPVIVFQHTSSSKIEGSMPWSAYPAFHVTPGDRCLSRNCKDAFAATPLDVILKSAQIRSLIIAGYLAEQCVTVTYRTACSLGYTPIVLSDGTASLSQDVSEVMKGMRSAPASQILTVFEEEEEKHG